MKKSMHHFSIVSVPIILCVYLSYVGIMFKISSEILSSVKTAISADSEVNTVPFSNLENIQVIQDVMRSNKVLSSFVVFSFIENKLLVLASSGVVSPHHSKRLVAKEAIDWNGFSFIVTSKIKDTIWVSFETKAEDIQNIFLIFGTLSVLMILIFIMIIQALKTKELVQTKKRLLAIFQLTLASPESELSFDNSIEIDQKWKEIVRKIGLIKRAEAEFEIQKEFLKRSRQLAHDIRSPLSALNLLAKEMSRAQTEKKDLLLAVSHRIDSIAKDLVKYPFPNSSNEELISLSSNSSIQTQIMNLIEEHSTLNPQIKYTTEVNVSDANWSKISDLTGYIRILSNILTNSAESFLDFDTQQPWIHLIFEITKDSISRTSISDNGVGIDPIFLSRIGNSEFTRGKKSGTGLGLYSAKKWVNGMGGRLEISSQVNLGTTVEILI